ncbi:AAA family ATPase [Nanoarchaeota archaeon NZ13-N]|uniref:AAA family ATPase n=1 Tax=Candidatus Nanoclepta minutus TaxID=1940235 RepID=A0A397WN35_9ARCH|nr:MAG: AAA family ATPase [Nanoarchaeota archaeon NZ13-N]RIB35480.1 MAG: AAA family ATPase [Candidatus Nanoclepta minutus]
MDIPSKNSTNGKIPEIKLKVGEAYQKDVYKGIVRMDPEAMKRIGVEYGEVVEIEGKKKTVAIAYPASPEDAGLGIIRMDGYIRKNAGVSLGSYVTVRKANVSEAQKVVLAPAQKNVTYSIPPSYLQRLLVDRPVMKGDIIVIVPYRRSIEPFFDLDFELSIFEDIFSFGFGPELRLSVVNTIPKGPVIITENTEIELLSKATEVEEEIPEVTYEDIGDMKEVVNKVRELVELPLRYPEIFERLGIEPPKGILLYGPPGTGKTLLAKAVANESGAHFSAINGPEIVSKYVGESERRLRDIFEEAKKNAPSIIFIDEIDAIAPKRDEAMGEVERRLVAQLLTLLDGLKERGRVIVIAATNRPDAVDPALRRPGRFDREIEVPVPNEEGRYEILRVHTRKVPLGKKIIEDGKEKYVLLTEEEKEKLLRDLASITYGYVGADLSALVKEAAMNAIRRVLPEIEMYSGKKLPPDILEKLIVTEEDFKEALKLVPPSAMREVLIEIPKVKWDDIGGLESVKQELKEAIEWPLKYRTIYKKIGIEPPKGILLYGPPGTGKTLLAKAVATEAGANFIAIKGPEVFSKWFGESEKLIREIFRKARQVAPTVIFFDEIDSIAPRRGYYMGTRAVDSIVNQLLTELDGISSRGDVVVIAATNRPDILDPALLRPGRIDRVIYVPPPDYEARLQILKIHTRNVPLSKDVNLEEIARVTEGYSGADLELLVKEAAIFALRESMEEVKGKYKELPEKDMIKKLEEMNIEVKMKHFNKALEKVKPSITKEMIQFYQAFAETFKKKILPEDTSKYYG